MVPYAETKLSNMDTPPSASRPSAFPKPAIKYLCMYGEGPIYALKNKKIYSHLTPGLKYIAFRTYSIATIFLKLMHYVDYEKVYRMT